MMITVVTTLYKGKKYLDSLLSNIQQNALGLKKSHTEVDVEYIIVNDYPTEKIRINDEIRAFEVIVIENENNCGIHESRAKAVNRARGEFIQFLDQDDHLADNALLSQFENIGSADVSVANGYESYNGELTAFYKNLRVQKLALKKIFYYYVGNQIVSPGQCLSDKYHQDFDKVKKWYDGYLLKDYQVYNPRAVVSVMLKGEYKSYWSETASYEAIVPFINMNYDGLKTAIIEMLSGSSVKVNTATFKNDTVNIQSKDDVLTYMIHLGYLGYDQTEKIAFVPNEEIRQELTNAVKSIFCFYP